MMHSLLSSLKEIHRDRRYIWSTTKHNTAISKKHPANDWPLWDLARAFWDAIFPTSACFSFAPLVSHSVGHGLLRLELCLFSSASPMCCAGQRETLTGIFQRVTSVWLAGCHQGNVRPVSAVSTRAVVARLIGDDGLLFWECQIQSDNLGSEWQGRRKMKSGKRCVSLGGDGTGVHKRFAW